MDHPEDTGVTKEHVAKAMTRRSFLRNTAAVAAGGMGALYLGGAGATALAADVKTIPPSAAQVGAAGTGLSPAKIQVKEISQIAIAVNDIKKTAADYWNLLGVGPWSVFDWSAPEVFDRYYRGKKAAADEWIALTDLKGPGPSGEPRGCQFELVAPGKQPSIYKDFLVQRGMNGIHHVQFPVNSIDEVYAVHDAMAEFGFQSIENGKFGGKNAADPGMFSYIDLTEPLGAIWEPVYGGGGVAEKPMMIPSTNNPVPNGKVIEKIPFISQLGVVVRDVEEACWNYWNLLGIGPWTVIDWEYPLVYDRKFHGKLHWARDKIALCMLGGVEFEVVAWYQGPSGYKEAYDKYGMHINHIQYLVPSWQDVYVDGDKFEKAGFPPIGSGTFGNAGSEGAYLYADCNKKLGTIWEPVKNGGANAINGNNAPRTIPPNADTYNYGR